MRVVCAMSGGVDSTVAAALMIEAGYEVIGMTMRLYDAKMTPKTGRGGTCCSPAEVERAKHVCDLLGIAHYVVDESARFERDVMNDFAREYAQGYTPNPCVRCNQSVKFRPLLARAHALGASQLVTGHYAKVIDGRLFRADDPAKDQSYFLFAMGREIISRVRFPLADWNKDDVRAKAASIGMPNSSAPDSQEICFVPDGKHAAVVEQQMLKLGLPIDNLVPGDFVDTQGEVLGRHPGIHHVTVGQRRGLALSTGVPRYVLRVVPESRTVVVGDKNELFSRGLQLNEFQRLDDLPDGQPLEVTAQVRHRAKPVRATMRLDGANAAIEFESPVSAVALGQATVVYRGEQVLGGGWIREVTPW